MTHDALGSHLLASVSRSFYLSIRVLPPSIRAPISVGYLLARTSDTIADSAQCPPALRQEFLHSFALMLSEGHRRGIDALQRHIQPPDPAEARLIAQLPACLDWLDTLPKADAACVRSVMATIIEGQRLDLHRFADPLQTIALPDASALEHYTYLVAGCVGEFWTQICLLHFPSYSDIPAHNLSQLGRDYGCALQLVNILRDLPADLRSGRCYLPADQLLAEGIAPSQLLLQPHAAAPLFNHWMHRAAALLQSGASYIHAIRPARVRIACFLPWRLGVKTLQKMRETPPLLTQTKVKVSRGEVGRALLLSALVARSNFWLQKLAAPLHQHP